MRGMQKRSNDKYALLVEFSGPGDKLEMHEHFKGNYHDMVVISGKVKCHGPNPTSWNVECSTGEFYAFTDEQQHHEIEALEENTVILNTYHDPQPHWNINGEWLEERK
jgi:tellurite resistance-related uncharacterized protein